MLLNYLKNEKGLTILEVLIASAIFMIGFSLLVFLLNQLITGFSIREYVLAYHLASETMEMALVTGEFPVGESIDTKSGKQFLVERKLSQEAELNKFRINIYRPQNRRLLVTLYAEKIAP